MKFVNICHVVILYVFIIKPYSNVISNVIVNINNDVHNFKAYFGNIMLFIAYIDLIFLMLHLCAQALNIMCYYTFNVINTNLTILSS